MDVAELKLSQGFVAVIDADCYDRLSFCEFNDGFIWTGKISQVKWSALVKDHTTYARATLNLERGRELRLHRVVVGARAGQLVDHRDGDGLNCRRQNLRVAGFDGNARNRAKAEGCTSQFKGVSRHIASNRWTAQIRVNRVKRHIGLFANEHDAARAYDRAAIEHFGEFARLNFPSEVTN